MSSVSIKKTKNNITIHTNTSSNNIAKNNSESIIPSTKSSDAFKDDILEEKKSELCYTHGIDLEQLNKIIAEYPDFMDLTPEEQTRIIKFSGNENVQNVNKNKSGNKNLKYFGIRKQSAIYLIKQRYKIDISNNISSPEDLNEIIKDFNLTDDEVLYIGLSNKQNKNKEETKRYNTLSKMCKEPAGIALLNKEKANNLSKLQKDYNALIAKKESGQTLTNAENIRLEHLKSTLNTKESKNLLKIAKNYIPKPEPGSQEELILNDWNTFNDELDSNDPMSQLNRQIAWIEDKTKDLTDKQKEKFITTILKYDCTTSTVRLFVHYEDKYKSLWDEKYLISEQALSADIADDEQWERHSSAVKELAREANDDEYVLGVVSASVKTGNSILAKCKGSEHDKKKVINSEGVSAIAEYLHKDIANEILKGTTDVNLTITNATDQCRAQEYIHNSKAYSAEVGKYEIDVLDKFFKENRLYILDDATSRFQEVTAYASENNAIAKLGENDRQAGYEMLKSRVAEQYSGDEAVKYTNAIETQYKQLQEQNTVYAESNQSTQDIISQVKEGTSSVSDFVRVFKTLDSTEQKELIKSGIVPISWCEQDSSLIPQFIALGKGLDIIGSCNLATGNTAITLMKKNPDARKELAALRPERFAKATYDDLKEKGIIKVDNNKGGFEYLT